MTDDWDRRCLMNILGDYYKPEVLDEEYSYSESKIYHQLPTVTDHHVRESVEKKKLGVDGCGGWGGVKMGNGIELFLCHIQCLHIVLKFKYSFDCSTSSLHGLS